MKTAKLLRVHGANRLGGNAVVDTVVFGKLAGETAVADEK